jgi:N-acetylmuramoyl-L-alanine amidase
LLGTMAAVFFAPMAEAGQFKQWRFDENTNRLEFSTDEAAKPTVQLISNPTRLVIDIPNTRLGKPNFAQDFRQGVRQIRLGQVGAQTRIVLELGAGYALDPKRIRVEPTADATWTVTIDGVIQPLTGLFKPIDIPVLDAPGSNPGGNTPIAPGQPPLRPLRPPLLPPRPNRPTLPSTPGTGADADIELPGVAQNRYVVVIDPGHGGPDPGAIGIGNLVEKDIVLEMSSQVAALLEQQGVRVVMTRSTDMDLDLQPRVDIAERARASVFVSIHANALSMSRPDINGFEIFFGQGSGQGQVLAQTVHESVIPTIDIGTRGVKSARFYVIRRTSMPSTLIETGFLTGADDAPKIGDPVFRQRMSRAIARGILRYLQTRP